jgi:rhodanese-related sulfurtransferase
MTINDLVNLDLPYAPPFTLAIDNFIVCAHTIENKLKGHLKGISAEEVKNKITNRENTYFLDVRGLDEFEMVRLGIGETLIPLDMLRKHLHELPPEKNREIVVYCKTGPRSYEAALFLESQGWDNIKVMEGGITAWPYQREK